jgi:hypothetical protein
MCLRLMRLSLLLLLVASSAHAITLQWLGGDTDIRFASATRCTLVAGVAAPDTALPSDLRLSWVAQNCPDLHVIAESTADPTGIESRVDEIVAPSELERGCRFQNVRVAVPGPHNIIARYIFELPIGARGNIRAEAARPAGGVDVSNVVTFNSGLVASFAPVVLDSRTMIEDNAVVVHARGIGLETSRAVRLVTADTSWQAQFGLVQRDDTSLTARNLTLNNLPEAMVQVTTADGDDSSIGGSATSTPAAQTSFSGSVTITDPNPTVVLKDFALVYDVTRNPSTSKWEGLYHVYYIRQIGGVGRVLAHRFSADLVDWSLPDTTEFVAGGGGGVWDAKEVWAPSLIKRGGLWYMFYTGVDATNNQSIGYATKPSLKPDGTTWQRRTTPVVGLSQVPYLDPTPPVELRDPFVIENPDLPGRLLMMFTAKNDPAQPLPAGYTVGLARNAVDLDHWDFVGRYIDTDFAHAFVAQDESPHAFRDPNVSTHWRLMWTAGQSSQYDRSISFEGNVPSALVSNTSQGSWGGLTRLYTYTQQSVGFGWAATEFLHTGEYLQLAPGAAPYGYTDFLAGYLQTGGSGIQISKLTWTSVVNIFPAHQDFSLDLSLTAVESEGGSIMARPSVHARAGIIRAPGECATLFMANSASVVIELVDVTGRVVRELLRQQVPRGATPIFWDLKDRDGATVQPGVFFVRLRSSSGEGVTRFALLR